MNKELLEQYVEVRTQIEGLSAKESELKSQITKEMEKEEVKKAETNLGIFTLAEYKRFEFSKDLIRFSAKKDEEIKSIKGEVKDRENREKETGKAKVNITHSLRFTPNNGQ